MHLKQTDMFDEIRVAGTRNKRTRLTKRTGHYTVGWEHAHGQNEISLLWQTPTRTYLGVYKIIKVGIQQYFISRRCSINQFT